MIIVLAAWIAFNLVIVLVAGGARILEYIAHRLGRRDPLELLWNLPEAER